MLHNQAFYFTVLGQVRNLTSSLLKCQQSQISSGRIYTPNIPDAYFQPDTYNFANEDLLTITRPGISYIFTLPQASPQQNCRGTGVAIQYCYSATEFDIDINFSRDIFYFLTLSKGNVLDYTVTGSFVVESTPNSNKCREYLNRNFICCDTLMLNRDEKFQIPSSNFTFALNVAPFSDLLVFSNEATEFRVPHIQTRLAPGIPVGVEFQVTGTDGPTERPLPLVRIDAGKGYNS
jgi:hypothetical protein